MRLDLTITHPDGSVGEPGTADRAQLGAMLIHVATQIGGELDGNETYRFARRIEGNLLGAVYVCVVGPEPTTATPHPLGRTEDIIRSHEPEWDYDVSYDEPVTCKCGKWDREVEDHAQHLARELGVAA